MVSSQLYLDLPHLSQFGFSLGALRMDHCTVLPFCFPALFTFPVLPLCLITVWFLASCEGAGSESSTSKMFKRKIRDAGNGELCLFWTTPALVQLLYKQCGKALLVMLKELALSYYL